MSSPLFEEWRRQNKKADEDTEQEIERFSREQDLDEDDRKYLKSAYGLAPQQTTPSYDVGSTSLDDYLGLGYEQFEADLGAGLKEAAPRVVKDLGGPDWLGTGLQKFGEYLDEDTEEELAQYEGLPAPPTREDYIKEGGIGGFLYGLSPEYTPTPEQFTTQIPGSLAPSAAGAVGALGTFALTRNPLKSGAAAMATSNAMASLQVAGSEYRQGLENPEIRDFLGVSRDIPFKDLPVEQQQQVSDFSGNVSARALKTRPVTSGALEMIGANPFVPSMALRFLIDVTTGTTSELMDREFSADYVVDEMVARGMSPGDAEDVRQRVLALGPSQKEVFVNALAQEIVLGGVGTVLEQGVKKIAGDPRIDTYQTEMNNFQKEVIEGAQGDVQNERRKEETHRLKMAQQFQKMEREQRKEEFDNQERARKANQAVAEFDQKIQGRAAQSADFADLFERLTDTYGAEIGVNEFLNAFDLGPDMKMDLFSELARRGNKDSAFLKSVIDQRAKEMADQFGLPEGTGPEPDQQVAVPPDRPFTKIPDDAQRQGGRRRVEPQQRSGPTTPGFERTAEELIDARKPPETGFQQTAEELVDKPIFSHSKVETAAEMEAQEGLGEAIDEGPQGVALTPRQFKLVTERLKKAFGPLKDKVVVFDTLEEAYMFGGAEAAQSEGFVVDNDVNTPIFLVRENIRGADAKDAVARAVKVFFHESIGHKGIHGLFTGENRSMLDMELGREGESSGKFDVFLEDFYKTNKNKIEQWAEQEPRAEQYRGARGDRQLVKEYIAINLAEQGPKDLSFIEALASSMRRPLREMGLTSAVTETDVIAILGQIQKELTGVGNETVLFGKMGPPVVRGGADAQEPISASRISRRDEEQFYGFQGKSKLSRYAKPERKRTRKSREDAFRDADDDLDQALVSGSWPKKLVKDLIQFDRLEPEYARGLAEALKSSNQGPAAKALSKRVLERAREGYQKQKTAQLSKDQMDALTSAPEDISYGKRENRSIRTARLFERLKKTEPAISQSLARKKRPSPKTIDGDDYADFILKFLARRERSASDIAPFTSPAEEEDFIRGVREQGLRAEPGMEADLESKKSRGARAKRLLKERAAEKRRKQRIADAKARKESRQKRIAKDPQDSWLTEKRNFLRGRGFTDDKLADVGLSDNELKRIEAGETFQGPATFAGTPMFSPSLLTEPRKTLTSKNIRNNRQHNSDQGFATAPDRMMDIWHYSQRNDLSEIDPDFYGTGIKGEELKDKQFPDWINRSYWGHTGYRREMGLPPYKYSLRLDHGRLYDLFGDPMALKSVAREADTPNFGNTYEKAIYQAGFDGYWVSEDAGGVMDAIAMFVPQTPNKFEWLPQGDQMDLREISPEPAELMSFSKMKKPPKKTMTAYKLFRLKKSKPGKIFPLFATDDPVEIGQWIRAKFVPREDMPKKAKSMKLAPRGGWHSAEEPAAHLKTTMASGEVRVWAEVEIGDDVEWQSKADAAKTKDIRNAVPRGGQYRFKRPANQGGFWRISGEMKVNRILNQDEVQQLDPNAASVISQSFAGVQGITGDTDAQNALVQAKAMELDKKPMDEIMAATGWFRFDAATGKERGKKGMWRYKFPNTDVRMKTGTRGQRPIKKELREQFFISVVENKTKRHGEFDWAGKHAPDGSPRNFTYNPQRPEQIERYYVSELAPNLMEDYEGATFETRLKIGDVFDLGRLGQMYPSLERIPIRFDNTEPYGSAMVGIDSRTVEQGRKNFKAGNKKDPGIKMFMVIGLGRPNPDGIKSGFQQEWIQDMMQETPQLTSITSTVLHELQHAIQHLEGFSSGGNPGDFRSMAYDKIMQDFGQMATETWQQMIPWQVRNDIGETFFALLDQHKLGGRTSRERKKNAVKAGFSMQTEPVTYPDMAGRDVTKNAFFQESPFSLKTGSTTQQVQNWAPKLEPRYLNVLAEAVSDVVDQGRVDVFQQTKLQNWFSNLKNYLQHPQEIVEQEAHINYFTTVGEIEARDVEQEYRDFVHENDSLSNVPAANHGFDRARRPWILGGIERGTAAARNFEALGTDFHAPWQRSMMISQSMRNLETEMRARQIEQLPKGSPQRISAIRALRRFYMLNPTSDTWLDTGYEEELKNAPPEQYSWSLLIKGDNPTPREKKLIIELLEKGKLFIDPSVFRAMLGDKPNALPIVMDFFKVQRDKVLKGQMSFRDAYKAHVLTTASQGMSGNSPWSPFEKTAGVLNMPDKFGSKTKGFRKSNLSDFANKLNQETGRSTYEGKQLTEAEVMQYYNKAPLVTVEDLPLNDSLHSSEAADPAFADIKKDLSNIADEFNGKKNSADRIMDFKTAVKMFQQGQKVKYQAGMAMDYGDTKPNISINPEYTAFKKKYNLTDEQLKPLVPQKQLKGKPVVDNKGNPVPDLKADTYIEVDGENIYVPPKHLFNVTREPTERHHYGRHTYIVGKKSKRVKKYLQNKDYKGEKSPGKPSGIRQGTTKLSELKKLYKDAEPTKVEDYEAATIESRPAGKTLSLWFRDPGTDKKPMPLTKGRTKGGVWVPNAYAQDDGKIRAEDGMAYWFSTEEGQAALAYAELAEKFYRNGNKPIQYNGTTLTQEDWEKGMAERWRGGGDIRTAMGDDRIMLPILGKEFENAKRTGDKWTLTLTEWVDFVNDKAKSYGNKLIENPGDSEKVKRQKAFDRFKFSRELSEETKKLSYIAVGKEGFFKHHLGLGDSPTVDAIEKAVLIAGTPNLNWDYSPLITQLDPANKLDEGDPMEFRAKGPRKAVGYKPGDPMYYYPDKKKGDPDSSWRRDFVNKAFAKMDIDQLMKDKMMEYYTQFIYQTPPTYNADGSVKSMGVKNKEWQGYDDDVVFHFIHHWMWDRAKGITQNSQWPTPGTKPNAGEIGGTEMRFRPGIYQAMLKDHHVLDDYKTQLQKGVNVLSYSRMLLNRMEPNTSPKMVTTWSEDLKPVLSQSLSFNGLTDQEIDRLFKLKHQISIADRLRGGVYYPMDPNNTLLTGANEIHLMGGWAYPNFNSMLNAGAGWAADAPGVITGHYNLRDEENAPFVDILLMGNDAHFGNKQTWQVIEKEIDWMIQSGQLGRNVINKIFDDMIANKATPLAPGSQQSADGSRLNFKAWGNANKKAASTPFLNKWNDMKQKNPKSDAWDIFKKMLAIPSGTSGATTFGNRLQFAYFLFGNWSDTTNGFTVNPSVNQDLNTLGNYIWDNTVDMREAPQHALVGTLEIDPNAVDPNISAQQLGIPTHPAYSVILPGKPVATFDIPIPREIYLSGQHPGNWLQAMNDFLDKQEQAGKAPLGRGNLGTRLTTVLGVPEALKRTKASESKFREGDNFTILPMKKTEKAPPHVGSVLSKFGQPYVWPDSDTMKQNLMAAYLSPHQIMGASFSMMPGGRAVNTQNAPVDQMSSSLVKRYQRFMRNKITKYLEPMGNLPGRQDYLKLRRLAKGAIHEAEEFGKDLYKILSKTKSPKQIYDYLTTRGADPSQILDPKERAAAVSAKERINAIGQELLNKGLIHPGTIQRYGDRYLPRVYLKYLLKEVDQNRIAMGQKPSDLGYLKQRKYIGRGVRELILGEVKDPGFLASRATMLPARDLALLDWLGKIATNPQWSLQRSLVDFDVQGEMAAIAPELVDELQLSDTSSHRVTPYWLKSEANRLRSTIMPTLEGDKLELANQLTTRMDEVANEAIGAMAADVPENYKQMPTSARYGKLRGMVVRKEIYDDIVGSMKFRSGDESLAEQVLGDTGFMGGFGRYWKWVKVSANPPSWVRNFVSNLVLLNLGGVPMYRIPDLFLTAIQDIKNNGAAYKLVQDRGLAAGTFANVELGRIERHFTDLQSRMRKKKQHPMAWAGMIKNTLQKFQDQTSDWYGSIDVLGKTMAVKWAMESGVTGGKMNADQAVDFAEKWLFDYSLVKPSVRYLRSAAFGSPFITFTSKVAPLMLETIMTKPWKLAPYYMLGWGMKEMFLNNLGLDDEEYEGLKESLNEYLRDKSKSGVMPASVIPLPVKDEQDRIQFFDVSYLYPWGMFSELFSEISDGDIAAAMSTLGMLGGPMANMSAAILTNTDPFTRKEIVNELDGTGKKFADLWWYGFNLATPPMVHSDFGAATRMLQTFRGDLTPEGEPRFTYPQGLSRLGGFNITPVDPQEARSKNARFKQSQILKLMRERSRRYRDLVGMKRPKEEIQEEMSDYTERIKEMREDYKKWSKLTKVPKQLKRAS